MKKVSISILKAALTIVLFTGFTIAFSTSGVPTVTEAKAAVSAQEVQYYLEQNGYKVHKLRQVQGSENWEAQTTINNINYRTTVFVEGTKIVGHEDIPM